MCKLYRKIDVITTRWIVFTAWVRNRTTRHLAAIRLEGHTLTTAILSNNWTTGNHQELKAEENRSKNVALYGHGSKNSDNSRSNCTIDA